MRKKLLPIAIFSSLFALASLTGCNEEEITNLKNDFQTQIDEVKEEIKGIKTQITTLKGEMSESIEAVKSDYQTKIDKVNIDIKGLEDDLDALEAKHDKDKAIIEADYNSKLTNLTTIFNTSVSELNTKIETNKTAITNLTNKHAQDILDVTSAYEAAISDLSASEEEAREALEEAFNASITSLNESFEVEVATLESAINTNIDAIAALTDKHNKDLEDLTKTFEAELVKLQEDEEANEEAIAALVKKHAQDIAALTESFEKEVTTLEGNISANKDAISILTNKLNKDLAAVISDYQKAISDLASKEASERASLKEELEASITSLNTSFSEQVTALQASINANSTAITNLTNQFNTDKAALQSDYNAKITALDNKYATEVSKINTAISALQTSLSNLQTELNTAITNIQSDYQSKINDLASRVGALEEVETHTVTFSYFDQNDELVELTTQVVSYGEKATRPELPEFPGYYFSSNWYAVDENGNNPEAWSFYGSVVTSDMDLLAILYPEPYTITLDENYSGAPSPYEKSGVVYSGKDFTCPVPTRTNYSFAGWYYGTTKVTDEYGNSLEPYNFGSDITLKAEWDVYRDGLSPESAYLPSEAIYWMDYYGEGNIVSGNVEYYVIGKVTNSKYNTKYGEWSCNLGSPTSEGKQFVVTGAHLSDGSSISKVDGGLDGAIIVVKGFLQLYQGVYKTSFLPANVSPTGAKYYPTLLI